MVTSDVRHPNLTRWAAKVALVLDREERTWAWLARKVGLHKSYLSRLIHGDPRYKLTTELKQRIAEVLNVPLPLLFSKDGQQQSERS